MDALGLVALVAHLYRPHPTTTCPCTTPELSYNGQIVAGNGCFRDVMNAFPYETLWELLNDPKPIDDTTFEYIVNWCRPRVAKGYTFVEAVLDSKLLETRSEVFRKVKESGMRWNGRRVTDASMPIEFFARGGRSFNSARRCTQ